jgi:hypothetical protein
MTSSDFIMHLHQPFQLQLNELLTMWLELDTVQESSVAIENKASSESQSFSVIFQGPQQPVLPARTYELSHPRLGKFNLQLVPLVRRETGMRYKASVIVS